MHQSASVLTENNLCLKFTDQERHFSNLQSHNQDQKKKLEMLLLTFYFLFFMQLNPTLLHTDKYKE